MGRKSWKGNAVSEGIAVAKAYRYQSPEIRVSEKSPAAGGETEQLAFFEKIRLQASSELDALGMHLRAAASPEAEIFAAQKLFLEEESILAKVRNGIREDGLTAEGAVAKVYGQLAEELAGVADPLIAERAADLRDVRARLLRICTGGEKSGLSRLDEDVILVAHDLLPSDTIVMDREHVKGIVTETGGYHSHVAILARSLRIPAIFGLTDIMEEVVEGSRLGVDGLTGEVILEPSERELESFRKKSEQLLIGWENEERFRDREAVMRDGTRILLGRNISGEETDLSAEQFDFVGLFRTEFLYMESAGLPDEEKQFEAYRRIVEQAEGRMVTLRTLDIGGDKFLPYMEKRQEANPFLGKRALRLCLDETELFRTQLRAALRASAYGRMQILFPMVGSMEDVARAKEQLALAKQELSVRGIPYDTAIRVGIMIEIPSIALMADLAAKEVDFASIGSNDLTQYVSAADRMNPEVAAYYQSLSPAMLRLLRFVFTEFNRRGRDISVCGEMAGDPKTAILLVGLGARKLSMSRVCLTGIKEALAGSSLAEAEELARHCLSLRTEQEIRECLSDFCPADSVR